MAKTPSDIKSLARSHTTTALKTLASIMNQSKAPAAARVAAANALLDRGWGKPKQELELEHRGDLLTQVLEAVADRPRPALPSANGHDSTSDRAVH